MLFSTIWNTQLSNRNTSSARGNTSLESAVSLTKSLRWEIQNLGQRLASAANVEELARKGSLKTQYKAQNEQQIKRIVLDIRKLLNRIEDAVPLINLAISASGATLSSCLPSTVSPSRLLQASTFLTAGDSQYVNSPFQWVQIGPTFTLSMYMLFLGHIRPQNEEDVRESTWKEVIHKAVVKLVRVPIASLYSLPGTEEQVRFNNKQHNNQNNNFEDGSEVNGYISQHVEGEAKSDEYAYQIVIVEDLDDDRLHSFEESEVQPGPYGDIHMAGIREAVPIHEISKIFYADTGKILNIGNEGETNSPVLLLKRDPNAIPPRRMIERHGEEGSQGFGVRSTSERSQSVEVDSRSESISKKHELELHSNASISSPQSPPGRLSPARDQWSLPSDLDPEWIAFEVYNESADTDSESEIENSSNKSSKSPQHTSIVPEATSALSRLSMATPTAGVNPKSPTSPTSTPMNHSILPPIRTSLSLLETLLRLLSLQQFQQTPHLSIPDELLNFFLSESASTGAATTDSQERKRLRTEARRRVGFDPYDESPVKRRGEDYQYRAGEEYRVGDGDDHWNDTGGAERRYQDYSPDERYRTPIRYGSPRYADEGYDTRSWSPSPVPHPNTLIPQTPPLLLKNGSSSSRSGTPLHWLGRRRDLTTSDGNTRRSSPLAAPVDGISNEGPVSKPITETEKSET